MTKEVSHTLQGDRRRQLGNYLKFFLIYLDTIQRDFMTKHDSLLNHKLVFFPIQD